MGLEDLTQYQRLDTQNMMGQIHALPETLSSAWERGLSLPLAAPEGLEKVVMAGMGGSAIGADLLAGYAAPVCPVPLFVQRDYGLPAWARGKETLVIAISHSGNTEETLSAFEEARARGCQVMVIGTGGRLAGLGQQCGCPVWLYSGQVQPRMAVGSTFGLLLAAFYRLGLLPDPTEELHDTLHALRNQQTNLHIQVPAAMNPAKREAGQMVGRAVTIIGAEALIPVARRWKGQVCENAKTWAQFDVLPEADHNSLAGLENPENILAGQIVIFLQAPSLNPRNQLRLELTRQAYMMQGLNTDIIHAKGETRLAHIWTLLHFGDYTSYYLGIGYGADPTPVDAIGMLKTELGKASENERGPNTL